MSAGRESRQPPGRLLLFQVSRAACHLLSPPSRVPSPRVLRTRHVGPHPFRMKGKLSNLFATPPEWDAPLPKWMRRYFWKEERQAQESAIRAEAHETWLRRGIDRRPKVDEFGDTVWPDSGL